MAEIREQPGHAPTPEALSGQRDADDDFFCLRYQVWYPSIDCGFRTLYETAPGCLACEQGRFNLKRHRATLLRRETRSRSGAGC